MKISKLYANKTSFKDIIFNQGFNVIFGDVNREIDEITGNVHEHNLGKTTLVELIDFLLLKKIDNNDFLLKHKIFSDWIFFLEIKLNTGKYITIRRSVNEASKISFKEHFASNQNFRDESKWNYDELSLSSTDENKNPKLILQNQYLQFNINTEFNFRSFLSYLLRTQYDYQDVFKLNKFKGKDKDWKPSLFELLGFDSKHLQEMYELNLDIKDEKKIISKLKNSTEDGEIYKIKAAIEAKEIERDDIKNKINNFNFYQKEQNIKFDLVKNIEDKVSGLNMQDYILNHNIEQIKKSLDHAAAPIVEVKEIELLFNEVQIFFPENLAKDYQDVINFTNQITKEREKYLKEELAELEIKRKNIRSELKALNQERIEMMSVLKEKDTFLKYKTFQDELMQLETEILSYKAKLDGAKSVETYQLKIENILSQIKNIVSLIKQEIIKENPTFDAIKRLFNDIYKKTFEYTALLYIEQNKSGNIEFRTAVLDNSKNLTGKADGYTSTKVLCASFVLALLVHYSEQSFFRFAYHDGILESWGNSHKINFIELVREYCIKFDIQYIISVINSDIPNNFKFSDKEIIQTFSKNDVLFGLQF